MPGISEKEISGVFCRTAPPVQGIRIIFSTAFPSGNPAENLTHIKNAFPSQLFINEKKSPGKMFPLYLKNLFLLHPESYAGDILRCSGVYAVQRQFLSG